MPHADTTRSTLLSRRTLLQQSGWFFYLTALIGAIWVWHYGKTGSQQLMPLFAGMLIICVALPFVSKIAEYQFFRRLLFPRKLKTTREGKWFLVLVITIGFAAINSGDNLLYLILAMMLSFIISSGILSENVLKGISITRLVPKHVFAGDEFRILLKVKNVKTWTSSYSLLLEDPDVEQISPLSSSTFIFRIEPQETVTVSYPVRIATRGVYTPGLLEVATLFPFHFFMKSMERTARAELVVYPPTLPVYENFFLSAATELDRLSSRSTLPGRKDFHSLRDYRFGDNAKWIHWRSSARMSKLVMKTFDTEESTNVAILFNNHISRPDLAEQYEKAIVMIASITRMFQTRNFSIQFIHDPTAPVPLGQSGYTGRDVSRIYRVLAGMQPSETPTTPSILDHIQLSGKQSILIVGISIEPDPVMERLSRQLTHGCVFRSICLQAGDLQKVMPEQDAIL